MPVAAGGTVSGTGQIKGPDGKVKQEFTLTSEPLTQAQADSLNKDHPEIVENEDGSNTPGGS